MVNQRDNLSADVVEELPKAGVCPACENVVDMKTDDGRDLPQEIGNAVICNNCAAELEIVDTDPLTFEMLEEAK